MAYVGRRARKRRNVQIVLTVLLLLVTTAVIGGVGYFVLSRPEGLDARMCPGKGPLGHHILLVDKTDPLTFTQKQAFSVTLRELVEKRTPEGYLLSVFVLGESFEANAAPIVELCNPGSGADKSELTANVRKLRRQYEEKFLKPLLEQAEALTAAKPAKASPVFEMLQLVAINGFRKAGVNGERRLIIVSDMLHNTPQFSMYRELPDFKAFSASPYGQKTQLDMPRVEVELHYLLNRPEVQTRRNLTFWEQHFEKAGARVVSVRPMEG